MLKLAEKSREERNIRKPELGNFSDNMRSFDEGSKVKEIRKEIKEKEEMIGKLREKQRRAKSNHQNEENLRLSSCIEFHQRVQNDFTLGTEMSEERTGAHQFGSGSLQR